MGSGKWRALHVHPGMQWGRDVTQVSVKRVGRVPGVTPVSGATPTYQVCVT